MKTVGHVAVDIGNSTAGLAVKINGRLVTHSVALGMAEWTTECRDWTRRSLNCEKFCWWISSVRSAAVAELSRCLSDSTHDETYQITHTDVPMEITVDSPDRLGIDRLLAAFAAKQTVQPPFAVADIGSAITVDWVDQTGQFCGGAILPGLSLQAESLHRWTEALPNLNALLNLGVETESTIRLPAQNTTEAIRGGILVGAAAAVDALASRYSNPSDPGAIVLTGGHAGLIAPHLRQIPHLLPNLVCRGLLELPRSKGYADTQSIIH